MHCQISSCITAQLVVVPVAPETRHTSRAPGRPNLARFVCSLVHVKEKTLISNNKTSGKYVKMQAGLLWDLFRVRFFQLTPKL